MEEREGPGAAQLPAPPSERAAWATAIGLATVGAAVLGLIASGVIGRSPAVPGPPAVLAVTPTPPPASAVSYEGSTQGRLAAAVLERRGKRRPGRSIVGEPPHALQSRDLTLFQAQTSSYISPHWLQAFYPIYAEAQRTFGVNWLLIASIHKQETAFSTNSTTYHGLNFAGCCGGPMQFNVTNGPVTTWALVSNSYAYGHRPSSYNHMTAAHPSIYDDFDAIMAAAHLLSADGAGYALDASAWNAAYDYYGHDLAGVTYADQVLARAIGWSQHGFCINCGVETRLVDAVQGAYGAPVADALQAEVGQRSAQAPARSTEALRRPAPARSARRRRGR
ncbi:MAG: hypothetical protein ACTHM1_04320 [Solirubrobacteraceae bacterium]